MARYWFIDYATQSYLLLVGLLVLFFHGPSVAAWPLLTLAHGAMLLLVHGLIQQHGRHPSCRLLDLLRNFYPVFLFLGFYRETGELNRMFVPDYLDPFFLRLEADLFGTQPSLAFMAALPFRAASELFYGAYFSYYLMIVGVGLALFVRDRGQWLHYLSVLCFLFYTCYLCYIFLPVIGPRCLTESFGGEPPLIGLQSWPASPVPVAVRSGVFYRLMTVIYRTFEARGAAFPSSHVVVAIGTAYFSLLYLKRVRVAHVIAVILLSLSTVYCRYHYVVDVIAGVLAAAVLIPVGEWLYARFNPGCADRDGRSCRAFHRRPRSSDGL